MSQSPQRSDAENVAGRSRRRSAAVAIRGILPSSAPPSSDSDLGGLRGLAVPPSGDGAALMRMRGADLRLERGAAERIATGGAGGPRDELRRSGRLEAQPGGRGIIHDRVTTVHVEADGTAHFQDEKDIDIHFTLPIPRVWDVEEIRKDLGHELTEWFEDPYAATRYGPSADLPRHLQASQGACDEWGATMCDDPLAPRVERLVRDRKQVLGKIASGKLNITDWLHRKYVGDPYASRKRKLLDDTFDERVAMGETHRLEQDARSGEYMRRNLERLWNEVADPVARRAALFELWDECGDDEPGLRARVIVIGWIRARLPTGSADAYTEAELAALQARRTSRTPFAPYAE